MQSLNQSSSKEIAQELLNRRAARKQFTEYCRYVAPQEPPAEHHELICNALDLVIDGEIRNLMVFMPPGSAKSTYASVRFPAYYLGRFPSENIICASYGVDLASEFGRKVRNLVASEPSMRLFPALSLAEDSKAKATWNTSEEGSYKAAGVGSGIMGRRAKLGVIDDPVKSREEADSPVVKEKAWSWYNADFLSRLKPNASQIIIQTRWVEDDLSGRLLPDGWDGESGVFEGTDGKTWHVLCLQAMAEEGKDDPMGREPGEWLWTDWFTPEFWNETMVAQKNADIRNWNALYQQRPAPDDGTFFRRSDFRWYKEAPEHLNKYITHDDGVTEETGDPTEIGAWGVDPKENLYLLEGWGGKESADVWIEQIIDMIDVHEPFAVVGESGPIRRSTEPFLIKRMNTRKIYARLEWLPTIGDKPSRARAFQALCRMGKVYLKRGDPYAEEFVNELVRFPGGKLDNKVDMAGLIGRAIHETWAARVPVKPKKRAIASPMTLNERLERQDKGRKRKTRSKRI